ncbi:MAG: PsbP-related protein [Nitrososphaeraceae archaeon]
MIVSILFANYEVREASGLFNLFSSPEKKFNYLEFRNPELGFAINYPEGWIHELHAKGLVTFLTTVDDSTSPFPIGLAIKVQQMRQKVSLEQITRVQISNLTKSHHDFRLLESKNYTLGGTHAHQVVFTASDSHKEHRKAMQIWTINNNKAYLITYKADPKQYSTYFPVIQKMVGSFRFTAK